MTEYLLRLADDLDYLQTLITSVGKRGELNPSLNAVHAAYIRRKFTGRFKGHGQSIELDTLLHMDTKGKRDDDEKVLSGDTKGKTSQEPPLCYQFQKGPCTFARCRYRHECAVCRSESHGAISCWKASSGGALKKEQQQQKKTKPPHPRYRRDRAQNE